MKPEPFADRLRGLRSAKNLSCHDLAALVGVTEGAIRQMESGQTRLASFVVGLRIAKALDVDPWFLATGVKDGEHETGVDQMPLRMSGIEQRVDALERFLNV